MRVGNFQSQAKLNQQMDDLLESLKHTDDCEKIKLLFDTQRELYNAKLEANKECFQETVGHLNGLMNEYILNMEQLNKRVEILERERSDKQVESVSPMMVEYQRILLENQKIMLESQKIQLENQKIQMDLISRKPAIQTCKCSPDESEIIYPYTVSFCSHGCRGKKISVDYESRDYYIGRLTELCESIPEGKQQEYEKFIQYVERGNFKAEHVVTLLEYEMEQKRLADEKEREIATKELELSQARIHYNQAYSVYRRHLVQCIGEEKSHGPTSQYANESWYGEHCRLWHIQSNALLLVQKLEQDINK